MKNYILPVLIAFVLQMIACPVMIPLLHKLKFGQYIRKKQVRLPWAASPSF